MSEIAYLDYVQESNFNGRKPAKISQEKIRNLKAKYNSNLKALRVTAEVPAKEATNVVPFPNVTQQVEVTPVTNTVVESNVVPLPTVNQVSAPVNVVESVSRPVVKNYEQVVGDFMMTVYEKSFDETSLAGARKIRISPKTKNETKGCSDAMAHGKIENVIPFPTPSVEVKLATASVSTGSNVVEFPKTQVSSSIPSPSVDDYLQKDKPSNENDVILQLAGDVESLKEAAVKQAALLEQLEARYNELKAQREQRIQELKEEKLSYTATLEGLTERIRNLQEAIQQEEQGLGSRKIA